MRKLSFILFLCLSCGIAAIAQSQPQNQGQNSGQNQSGDDEGKAQAYFGYVYTRQSFQNQETEADPSFNMNGGLAQFAYRTNNWFSVVAEFGVSAVTHINGNFVNTGLELTYMGGPRYTYRHGRLQPYAQGLIGGGHINTNFQGDIGAASGGGIALALGGGADLKINSHFAFRIGQADYLLTRFDGASKLAYTQNNFRYSSGLVIRF
jgi:hypothetical protein